MEKLISIGLFLFLTFGCQITTDQISQTEKTANKDQNSQTAKAQDNTIHDNSHLYALPYAEGTLSTIGQGYNSIITHYGQLAYSIDFLLDEGTPILASKDGTVIQVIDNFNEGAPDLAYWNKSNTVVIQHDDGTAAWYGHNQYKSAKVKVGDKVKMGDELALVGCTGYCSTPHIHFHVQKEANKEQIETIPTLFKIGYEKGVKLVEETAYKNPGNKPFEDITKDYPEDSLARLPYRLKIIVDSIEDKEEAAKAVLDYLKENEQTLKNEWKELTDKTFAGDRTAQNELVIIMNDCYYCMNIQLYPGTAKIFDPDPGVVFEEPLVSEESNPKMSDTAFEALMLYWNLFSYE